MVAGAANVVTLGDAAQSKPTEQRAPVVSERLWMLACWAIGLTAASFGLIAMDFFTFGSPLGSGMVGELFSINVLGGYAAELTLVMSVAALITVRSVSTAPQKVYSPQRRKGHDADMAADGPGAARPNHAQRRSGSGRPAPGALDASHSHVVSEARAKCNETIDHAVRSGDWMKAEQSLLEFERLGGQPEAMSYNLVIRACARRGDVVAAEKWLHRMEAKGVRPTPHTYNTMLDASAKAGNAEACAQWLSRMTAKGIQPDVMSYGAIIYACARQGDVANAQAWLEKMVAAGVEPDAITYSTLIHACGVKGDVKDAERWLQELESRGLEASVTTYTAVIDACAKCGDVDRAEFWLARMIEKGVEPNAVSFSALMDSCAKAGNFSRAEHWHKVMLERGIPPDAHSFSAVINACAKQVAPGRAEAAEKWLERAELAGVGDMVIYTTVIDACGKAGDAERALRVFRRMQTQGFRPQIVTYAALARPFAHRGDWVQVESIAQEMSADGVAVNEFFLYAQLISYAVARQGQRAEACFRSALRDGVKANDHVVTALLRAVGRQRCAELLKELCGRSELPPRRGQEGPRGRGVRANVSATGAGGASGRVGRQ